MSFLRLPTLTGSKQGVRGRVLPNAPLAMLDCAGRSFANDPEGGLVDRAWLSHAARGGRVAFGETVPPRGALQPT